MRETFGHIYVYLIYGMYHCLNITSEREGIGAVLIRAVEPIENITLMRRRRGNPPRDIDIASGPGKLCLAMSIDKDLNREDMEGKILWIEDRQIRINGIATSPRVGVDYAGEYRDKPWRFYINNNPHVSRVKFSTRKLGD